MDLQSFVLKKNGGYFEVYIDTFTPDSKHSAILFNININVKFVRGPSNESLTGRTISTLDDG